MKDDIGTYICTFTPSTCTDAGYLYLYLYLQSSTCRYLKVRVRFTLLGRVALGAQRPTVIKLSRRRSVGRSVGRSSTLWKTGDRIRVSFGIIGRAGPGMRQVVVFGDRSTEKGALPFGANLWRAIVTNGDFTTYVCDSAATRPSSQITLGRLVTLITFGDCCCCESNYCY